MSPVAGGLRAAWRAAVTHPGEGRLPLVLVVLTAVSGAVDAVSVLALGRVFVANMTGNVVFVGFAIAGARGFSIVASALALGGFLLGAAGVVRLARRPGSARRAIVAVGAVELVLLVVVASLLSAVGTGNVAVVRAAIVLLAVALGAQSTVARRAGVPGLTTTVLTMTLAGMAEGLRDHSMPTVLRGALAVAAMFSGGVASAELVVHGHAVAALWLAVGLLVVALTAVRVVARGAGATERSVG